MSYGVLFTQRALKDFKVIDSRVQKRLISKLREYAKSPMSYARKLINPKIGAYRFRIGEYRVIFDIKQKDIVILRVGHRREIYK